MGGVELAGLLAGLSLLAGRLAARLFLLARLLPFSGEVTVCFRVEEPMSSMRWLIVEGRPFGECM